MAILLPGDHLYHDGVGSPPVRVKLAYVEKDTLGVFFEGRHDYDLVTEVSGRFVPRNEAEKDWDRASA